MTGFKPLVSVVIVAFNSQNDIKDCLNKIFDSSYTPLEVIVVDNHSTDGTCESVKKNFPKVKLIESKKNLGYTGGNNLGAKLAKGEYLVIVNPDTRVSKSWLEPLILASGQKDIAVCQPKIMLAQKKDLLNATGKITQFLGFEYLSDYKKRDYKLERHEITSFSGSTFLIKRNLFLGLGGFDEDFFMYYEDGDLAWRLRLSGYHILFVPDSVVYHAYKFNPKEDYQKARTKFYLLERNRLAMVIKNYQFRSLLSLLPAISLMEIGMICYFLTRGWCFEKWKGYWWLVKNCKSIMLKRKKIQMERKVTDKILVKQFSSKIEFAEFDNLVLRYLVNPFLYFYWSLVKTII
ncbi:MAG: glycosyltransferase family 2 protein [bacterium]|nr:glycosyltransferase family 2 protein [bacterium]